MTSTVDQQIDENLKRAYDDVLNEDVPSRFLDLIEQLKAAGPDKPPDRKDADGA
jgi:hypothetical protein